MRFQSGAVENQGLRSVLRRRYKARKIFKERNEGYSEIAVTKMEIRVPLALESRPL